MTVRGIAQGPRVSGAVSAHSHGPRRPGGAGPLLPRARLPAKDPSTDGRPASGVAQRWAYGPGGEPAPSVATWTSRGVSWSFLSPSRVPFVKRNVLSVSCAFAVPRPRVYTRPGWGLLCPLLAPRVRKLRPGDVTAPRPTASHRPLQTGPECPAGQGRPGHRGLALGVPCRKEKWEGPADAALGRSRPAAAAPGPQRCLLGGMRGSGGTSPFVGIAGPATAVTRGGVVCLPRAWHRAHHVSDATAARWEGAGARTSGGREQRPGGAGAGLGPADM